MLNEFIALDFETANSYRASVCEIGAVKVINGIIVETLEGRFRPPQNMDYFDYRNIQVHGIKPEDVEDESMFYESLSEVNDFIGGRTIVAHNASFEKSVLNKTEEYVQTQTIRKFECTMLLARKKLPQLINHKLPTVVQHLGIEFNSHEYHGALYDAMLSAKVYARLSSL